MKSFKKFRGALILLLIVLTAISGCAKEKLSIGKGDPSGEFKTCLNLSSKGKHEDAIQCMEMFKARYPKTLEGQEAELKIGDVQFSKKEYLLAAETYLAFLRIYPSHPRADYAHYRAGVAYYKESPKSIDRDQEYLDNAIEQLRTVVRYYPRSNYIEQTKATLRVALNRIARRQFYIGRFYYKTGEYIACLSRFKEVAESYPDSGLADRALYLMVDANLKLKNFNDAKNAFSALLANYPKSKFTKTAEKKMLRAAKS